MKVAILGGGVIGGGWAARFALNGHDVALYDPDPEAPRKLEAVMAGARRALPMLYDHALPPEGATRFRDSVAATCEGADWVQECAPERLELKHRLLAEAQDACDAPIGSSTSGFTPSRLAEGAVAPERIVVAHPFNPVYLLPLVELVGGPRTEPEVLDRAETMLTSLGMRPLRVRAEIDAHIADRFLEAVWREALWLVKDGIATTHEIDEAIRMGFGLRWAQMGLFETYRIAGGEAGMKHFLAQFGPALKWPWTRLTDVPELDDALSTTIAEQSDAQSGHLGIRELERLRDDNLVGILRALRGRDAAAGAVLNAHDRSLRPAYRAVSPMRTQDRTVPVDWTDYNGHMNESRYGQVFSDAADAVLIAIGTGPDYAEARGLSWFTVSSAITYEHETLAGERIGVTTTVLAAEGKKLRLSHAMTGADGTSLASCEQLLLHVDLAKRKSCPPPDDVAARLAELAPQEATR